VSEVLSLRALNRATLARQMLLAREKTTALKALERLAGLQAQVPRPPYLALWARVQGFRPEALTGLAHDRQAVRATMMRGTLHLVSAGDYLRWRPLLQPMLSAGMRGALKDRSSGLDVDKVTRTARDLLAERPLTFDELRPLLKKAWPKADERALGYAVRMHLPLVQIPTDARWGWPASSGFALAEPWLKARLPATGALDGLVLRYLAALGPATVADAQNWSGMQGLKDTFEALRPKLRTFRDERGRELFDLPKAPRPPAATPAPVRFLPDYDTLLLGHADRTRVVTDEHRKQLVTKNLQVLAAFLVDGQVAGTWKVERARTSAALVMAPFLALPRATQAELITEGKALLQFMEPDAAKVEVRFGR
jgi:hypothetical protein